MFQELLTIITSLEKKGKMSFNLCAMKEDISRFEKKNRIIFPSQFREWLNYSDGGECYLPAGVQFYGVAHKPLIKVNDKSIPNGYIIIGALPNGDPILLKKGADTVSIYNQEAGRIENDEIYKDFFSFLNDLHNILGIGV